MAAQVGAAAVYDQLRPVARALLAQGYTLEGAGHHVRIIDPAGTYTGLNMPNKSKRGHQDNRQLLKELERRGIYPPQPQQRQAHTPGLASIATLPVQPRTSHQYRLEQVRDQVIRVLRDLGGADSREARRLFVEDALATAAAHGLRLPSTRQAGPPEVLMERRIESARHSLGQLLAGKGQAGWMLDIWQLEVNLLQNPQPQAATVQAVAQLAASTPLPAQIEEADGVVRARGGSVRTGGGTPAAALPLVVPQGRPLPEAVVAKRAACVAWLRALLAGGPVPSAVVHRAARAEGYGARTLDHARGVLQVEVPHAQGYQAGRVWQLPGDPAPAGAAAAAPADGPPSMPPPPAPRRQPQRRTPPAPRAAAAAGASADDPVVAERAAYLAGLRERALAGDEQAAARLERILGLA